MKLSCNKIIKFDLYALNLITAKYEKTLLKIIVLYIII